MIETVLGHAKGNQTLAAAMLGIDRNTLRTKMQQLRIKGVVSKVKRALISVSDKSGVVEFARALAALGVELLSTGGTAQLLEKEGLAVTEVSAHTGFPEMLDGRVKTLHPKIHGGLLARRDDPAHIAAMRAAGIEPIDLVVVNLYPFQATVADPDCRFEDAIENIDIGGPAMLRSAAKNHAAWRWWSIRRTIRGCWRKSAQRRGQRGDALRARDEGVRAHRGYDGAIANYLTSLDEQRRAPEYPDIAQPAVLQARRTCATARTRTRAPRSTATRTRSRAASRSTASCRARSSPTTTSPTPTRRGNA